MTGQALVGRLVRYGLSLTGTAVYELSLHRLEVSLLNILCGALGQTARGADLRRWRAALPHRRTVGLAPAALVERKL